MYQVNLLDGNRVVRQELFRNYECAMAFFDISKEKWTCEFKDLKFYTNWRYTAN